MGRVWFTCRGRDEWCRKVRQKSNEILKLTNAKQLKKNNEGPCHYSLRCNFLLKVFHYFCLSFSLRGTRKLQNQVGSVWVGGRWGLHKNTHEPIGYNEMTLAKNTIDSIAPRLALGFRLVDQIQFCRFGTGDIDKVQPFDGGTS